MLPYKVYTKEDGLINNFVSSVLEDHDGFLWLGTEDGIARFDGNRFVNYKANDGVFGLTNKIFRVLMAEANGNLWVSNYYNSLFLINTRNKKLIKHYVIETSFGNEVSLMFQDKNKNYWLGIQGVGLCSFQPDSSKFNFIPTFTDESELAAENRFQLYFSNSFFPDSDSSNIYWIPTLCGLLRLDASRKFCSYTFNKKDQLAFSGRHSISLNNNIYSGSWSDGVIMVNSSRDTLFKFKPANEKIFAVSTLADLGDSKNIIMQTQNGLALFNSLDKKFNYIENLQHFKYGQRLFKSSNGLIWMASWGEGLIKIQPKAFLKGQTKVNKEIRFLEVIGNQIHAITSRQNYLVLDHELNAVTTLKIPLSRKDDKIIKIIKDQQGRTILLSYYDIFRLDPYHKTIKSLKTNNWKQVIIESNYFWDIETKESDDEIYYIATQNGGILVMDSRSQQTRWFRNEPQNPHSIKVHYSIGFLSKDQKGNLWGSGWGIFCMDKNERFINLDPILKQNSDLVRFSAQPLCAFGEDQMITISDVGAWYSLKKENDNIIVSSLNDNNKVTSHTYRKLRYDHFAESVFAFGESGLMRLKLKDSSILKYDLHSGFIKVYDMQRMDSSKLLLATDAGLILWDESDLENEAPESGKIYIENFRVFDQPIEQNINEVNKILLSYSQNFFSVEFGIQNYFSEDAHEFEYKLAGVDDDWVAAGLRNYAGYTNIGGGNFIFSLRSKNAPGIINFNEIVVSTPFWKQLWFLCLIVLVIGFAIYTWNRSRILRIKKEAAKDADFHKKIAEVEMKALRSQMNPHFLFNSLNAIKYYVVKKDPDKAADYLTSFSKLIRMILNNSNQKLISLKDEMSAVQLYIHIENLRFDHGFDYNISIDQNIDTEKTMVPPLLFQPYIENAIWHGLMHKTDGLPRLEIALVSIPNGIECTITDNGIGRQRAAEVKSKTADKNKSWGMTITKSRMTYSEITSDLAYEEKVIDLYDSKNVPNGTKVIISIHKKW